MLQVDDGTGFLLNCLRHALVAFRQMVEAGFQNNECADVVVLAARVHGPGVIHMRNGVARLQDTQGLRLRAPTRTIVDLLSELGAEPVGKPRHRGLPVSLGSDRNAVTL